MVHVRRSWNYWDLAGNESPTDCASSCQALFSCVAVAEGRAKAGNGIVKTSNN